MTCSYIYISGDPLGKWLMYNIYIAGGLLGKRDVYALNTYAVSDA